MRVKELISLLSQQDPELGVFHYEIGGQFPIDTLVHLEDGNIGLAQMESVETDEEE